MNRSLLLSLLALCLLFVLPACDVGDDDDVVSDDDDAGDDDAGDDDDDALVLPTSVQVQVTLDGVPVQGAQVLQGGTTKVVLSDAEGGATLSLVAIPGDEVWVIAALEGHRSVGEQLDAKPEGAVLLDLTPVQVDNADYSYGLAGTDDRDTTEYCSHCHISATEQFAGSAHFVSARDEQVHDLFAGTAGALGSQEACAAAGGNWLPGTLPGGAGPGDRCYIGVGLLPDAGSQCGSEGQPTCDDPNLSPEAAPGVSGACADCHAPAVGGPLGGGHSLLSVEGEAYNEGITCDFCHKVADIDLDAPPGIGGRTVLGRPLEIGDGLSFDFKPVMYGPYPDVINPFMGGAVSPIFSNGELCAGCHEYEQSPLWDHTDTALDPARWPSGRLPVHSTWSEWSGSIHAPATPCQICHMPATGALNSADIEILGLEPGVAAGFHRDSDAVRDHGFSGPLDERPGLDRLIDIAAAVTGTAAVEGNEIVVSASVSNFQAGHGLPTGEPLRSMLLLVEASCGEALLEQTQGPSLTAVAGALAVGVVGEDVTVDASGLLWSGLNAVGSSAALQVTAHRPTGTYLDYDGVGPFATSEGGFAAAEKGFPELLPLGRSGASLAEPGLVVLSEALSLEQGDLVTLGEEYATPVEGGEARMLAGHPGIDFARVLADAGGAWPVPHHRAVDVVRDNRLLPYASDSRNYRFARPEGCDSPQVSLHLIYRRYPPGLARERALSSTDNVMVSTAIAIK